MCLFHLSFWIQLARLLQQLDIYWMFSVFVFFSLYELMLCYCWCLSCLKYCVFWYSQTFKAVLSAHEWDLIFELLSATLTFPCSYLPEPPQPGPRIHSPEQGEGSLMKISADLGTFEIVLFKSTMPCIHTYFIVHARRSNGNYLWGPRREGDKGKER